MAKTPLEIKSLARQHTVRAIQVLAGIMDEPESGASARVTAAQALLDRGWGKPTQPHSGDDEAPPIQVMLQGLGASIDAKLDRLAAARAASPEEQP